MAVTLTTNSTPGAPALTNVAGQLIALFDFALLPNGWNKIWSGTNAAAYQSPTSVSQHVLRVSDTGTTYARVNGYETLNTSTGVGTNPFSSSALYVHKSSDAVGRAWRLITDGSLFYFFGITTSSNYWYSVCIFGDIPSYLGSDNHACILQASITTTASSDDMGSYASSEAAGRRIARAHTQVVGGAPYRLVGHPQGTSAGKNSGPPYPALIGTSLLLYPIEVWEVSNSTYLEMRGLMPGLYVVLNNTYIGTIPDLLDVVSVPGYPGRTFTVHKCPRGGVPNYFVFDMTGPWS